jgi:hypothetical protein
VKLERRNHSPLRLTHVTAWTPREMPHQPEPRVADTIIVAVAVLGIVAEVVYQLWRFM